MTTTKIGGFTRQQLIDTPIIKGFQLINKSERGFEIIDRRDLRIRLYEPVKGRGVKYTIGVTHFIVTSNYYANLIK